MKLKKYSTIIAALLLAGIFSPISAQASENSELLETTVLTASENNFYESNAVSLLKITQDDENISEEIVEDTSTNSDIKAFLVSVPLVVGVVLFFFVQNKLLPKDLGEE